MSGLFQRHRTGTGKAGSDRGAARLTLGVFGKHPGWDDHILGIGAETETLADVRQALYVAGIGGQIDSGAWEQLEPERRLPGYEHTFLWLIPGHVILGQIWSSTDGKGRSKYPMVLAIDGEALPPDFMLRQLLPGLDLLRQACKATNSADQVTRDCGAAQEQLRGLIAAGGPGLAETPPDADSKKRFLESSKLAPDRLGFQRVLHELETVTPGRSRHLRLPLATDSPVEALLLWIAFLRCTVPESVPLLLLTRGGADWLDVIVGEPESADFFCLQASARAVPLATEIPYDLSSNSAEKMRALEARFLGVKPEPPAAATPPPPKVETSFVAPPSPGTEPIVTRGKWISVVFLLGGLLLVGAVLAVWFTNSGGTAPKPPPVASNEHKAGDDAGRYQALLKEAQEAFGRKDYSNALAKAEAALALKPGDAAATKVKTDSQAQLDAFAAQVERQRMFTEALAGSTNAWQRGEDALRQNNYEEALREFTAATNECAKARSLGDTAVPDQLLALLAVRRTAAQDIMTQDLGRRQQYTAAMAEATNALTRAEAALQQGQLQAALAHLSVASNQCATARALGGSAVVDRLMTVLSARVATVQQASQAASAKASEYAAAMTEATNAWNRAEAAFKAGQYDTASAEFSAATNHCGRARALGDSSAPDRLVAMLEARRKEAQNAKQKAQDYAAQLQRAQDQFDKGEYAAALGLCEAHPGDARFQDLKAKIVAEQNAFNDYSGKFTQGDYAFLDLLRDGSYRNKAPFAALYAKAAGEKQTLEEFAALKRANNAAELKKRLADPASAAFAGKPPFQSLRQWAETTSAQPPKTQASSVQELDSRLEELSVNFGVISAKKAVTVKGREANFLDGSLGPADQDYYLGEVRKLGEQFKQRDALTAARQRDLAKIENAIRNHP